MSGIEVNVSSLDRVGDPLADEVVRILLDSGTVADVNALFHQIVALDQSIPQHMPDVLRGYLVDTGRFPDWADPQRIAGIGVFYSRHKAAADAVLATAGLVGTYLSPIGAKTLHSTHALDHPQRRLRRSARLFMNMGDADAFTHASRLIPTCQKVRLVHAMIRQLHQRSGRWDTRQNGVPVSQHYMYVAALIFCAGTLQSFDHLGLSLDETEADGFAYAWKLIAYWLGIPEDVAPLPETADEACRRWDAARETEWQPSPEGVLLTHGCVEHYESHLPHGVRGLVPTFLRRCLTDRYADMVEIPHGNAFDTAVLSAVSHSSRTVGHGGSSHIHHVLGHLTSAVASVAMHGNRTDPEAEPQLTDHLDVP